jgi:GT2 family glycosyltransferase
LRTAAVVVDWRKPDETLEALHSLSAMTLRPDLIVCVENGSAKEGIARVRKEAPPGTALIEMQDNIGFAAAANAGVEHSLEDGAEWILLLNNDALVAPGCLARCLQEGTSHRGVAAVGPAIAFADRPDILWYGGGEMSDWFAFTRHRGLMKSALAPPPTGETAFVSGCCMLLSADAWRSIGSFRSEFFAYYEDAEWCQRARFSGWTCRYVGEVLCAHAVSVSSGRRDSLGLSETTAYYKARNPIRAALDSTSLLRRVTRLIGLLTVWNGYHALRLVQSRRRAVLVAYWKGIVDGFKGRMGKFSLS